MIGNRQFIQYIDSYFEEVQVYRFPDGHRPFNEIVLFGRKRKIELPGDATEKFGTLHQRGWQWQTLSPRRGSPAAGIGAAEVVAWQSAELGPGRRGSEVGDRAGLASW